MKLTDQSYYSFAFRFNGHEALSIIIIYNYDHFALA